MKGILLTIFTLLTNTGFGQMWITYKVDSSFTILLPENYTESDTLGQHVITAKIENGLILMTKIHMDGPNRVSVQDEKDLVKLYKEFRTGFVKSQNGKLIKEEMVNAGRLKFWQYSFSATLAEEKQLRHCLALFVNNTMHVVTFWELESMTHQMVPQREKLFSSIVIPVNLGFEDQMTEPELSVSYRVGYFVGQSLFVILLLGGIVALIFGISKQMKRRRKSA